VSSGYPGLPQVRDESRRGPQDQPQICFISGTTRIVLTDDVDLPSCGIWAVSGPDRLARTRRAPRAIRIVRRGARCADLPDPVLALQPRKPAHRLLERRLWIDPVKLVQVHALGRRRFRLASQAARTVVGFPATGGNARRIGDIQCHGPVMN